MGILPLRKILLREACLHLRKRARALRPLRLHRHVPRPIPQETRTRAIPAHRQYSGGEQLSIRGLLD